MIRKQDIQKAKALFKEWDNNRKWDKASALFINHTLKKAEELLQVKRAKEAVDSLQAELNKRTELTYRSTKDAELSFAKTSIERAEKFWEIVNEYLEARKK